MKLKVASDTGCGSLLPGNMLFRSEFEDHGQLTDGDRIWEGLSLRGLLHPLTCHSCAII